MQKREWVISICILCVLALCAAGLTGFVLQRNRPEKVAAFENRFLDLTELGITATDVLQLSAAEQQLTVSWPAGKEELTLETAAQPLADNCAKWQLDLSGSGTQNAAKKDRWGYQVWLELVMLRDGQAVAASRTEMPLEGARSDRTRVYTVQADAAGADSWHLRVIITPVDGAVAEGSLILKNWEVYAR